MVALAFEQKKQLAIGDSLDLWRAGAKRLLKIAFPQIVGLSHMTVDIDNTDGLLRHTYLRSRRTSSTMLESTTRSNGRSGFPCWSRTVLIASTNGLASSTMSRE